MNSDTPSADHFSPKSCDDDISDATSICTESSARSDSNESYESSFVDKTEYSYSI